MATWQQAPLVNKPTTSVVDERPKWQQAPPRATSGSETTSPAPSVGKDVLYSAGSGLAEGGFGLAGLAGDIDSLAHWAGSSIGNKLRDIAGKKPVQTSRGLPLPTTQEAMDAVGFKPYEPKTTAGEYARTVSSFIPAAAAGGVTGGLKGMTSSAIKYGVMPGLASESAGQATEGTAAEPFARAIAPIVAGVATGYRGATTAKKQALDALPDADELKAISQQFYKAAERQGVVVQPQSFTKMVDDLVLTLNKAGIDRDIQPKAFAAAKRLIETQRTGVPPTFQDMNIFRELAGGVLKNTDTNEVRIAGIIVDKLDDFMRDLKPSDLVSGNAKAASVMTQEARKLWSMKSKAERVGKLFDNAWDRGKSNYTGAGFETALRQEFKTLNKQIRDGRVKGFTDQEKRAIQAVVDGGTLDNVFRFFGKFAPRGLLSGGGLTAATSYGGPIAGGAYLLASEAGKELSSQATINRARMVDAIIRSGGSAPQQLKQSELVNAIVGGARTAVPRLSPLEMTITRGQSSSPTP